MKTALVHDWLVGIGGAEKVLQAIAELYPSPIYTLVKNEKKLKETYFAQQNINSSFLQSLPWAAKCFRNFLPFFPLAIEQFDLKKYDIVISSSHAVAKGVMTYPHQLHICYCHTPVRYAWDLYHEYLKDLSGLKKPFAKWSLHHLRNWDFASSSRVDYFVANSNHVRKRIKKLYGREAELIYPPVSTHLFNIHEKREDYYVTVSRLVPYKRVDLIVEGFSKLGKTLLVVGEGPDLNKIKAKASKNIHFLGSLSDDQVAAYVSKAKAFVFAAEEDFGIALVEAQAAGIPVVAFGKGGALETVIHKKTGLFYREQTAESLHDAILAFELMQDQFEPLAIKQHAELFNEKRFKEQFKAFVDSKVQLNNPDRLLFR
jgi:glycosyltransferase involved in cell wall biosynthesis